MDTPFFHFPFCADLVSVADAQRVTCTPTGKHCIHPLLFMRDAAGGTALEQRSLPAARTDTKKDT